MAELTLSNTLVDFDSIRSQLENHVATKDAWKGFHATQSGQTIIDLIAAVGVLNGVKLMRYYQDAFPATALSDEAIYNIAEMQGVRLSRRNPMHTTVELFSTTGVINVPKFSQFLIGGTKFFNRSAFTVPTGTIRDGVRLTTAAILYQGEVVRRTTNGLGTDYQVFMCRESDFQVSDQDIEIRINGATIERELVGNWRLRNKAGCRDRTLPSGKVILEFGNGQYGSRPGVNDVVEVIYVVTDGLKTSSVKTLDKKVKCDAFPSIGGTATANPSGGSDQQPIELYKNVSAASFGTFGSAVTRDQYVSTMLSYSGVIDAAIYAQRDINPNAAEWMNVMKMVVLTSTTWDDTDRAAFVKFIQDRSMYSTHLIMEDPMPMVTNVRATVFCYPWADLSRCQQDATIAVQKLFTPRPGILGYTIFLSDIYEAVKEANPGIEYVRLHEPTADLHASNTPMEAPTVAISGSGGYLTPGSKYWGVSPVLSYGEIAPAKFVPVLLSGAPEGVQINYSVTLSWPAYPNAVSYKVWGRLPNRIGLLAHVPDTTWTDNGTIADPEGGSLPVTTVPLRFNALRTVKIAAAPSDRTSSLMLNS